jgi:hypothetical protein
MGCRRFCRLSNPVICVPLWSLCALSGLFVSLLASTGIARAISVHYNLNTPCARGDLGSCFAFGILCLGALIACVGILIMFVMCICCTISACQNEWSAADDEEDEEVSDETPDGDDSSSEPDQPEDTPNELSVLVSRTRRA